MEAPMPFEAPVTTATFSLSLLMFEPLTCGASPPGRRHLPFLETRRAGLRLPAYRQATNEQGGGAGVEVLRGVPGGTPAAQFGTMAARVTWPLSCWAKASLM